MFFLNFLSSQLLLLHPCRESQDSSTGETEILFVVSECLVVVFSTRCILSFGACLFACLFFWNDIGWLPQIYLMVQTCSIHCREIKTLDPFKGPWLEKGVNRPSGFRFPAGSTVSTSASPSQTSTSGRCVWHRWRWPASHLGVKCCGESGNSPVKNMAMFGHIFRFPLLHLQDFEGWVGGVQCFIRVVFSRILEMMQWSSLSQPKSENDALMSHASPLSPPSNSCSILHSNWAESLANRKRMGEKIMIKL